MTIAQLARRGGIGLIGILACAVLASAYSIDKIRFGGEMHRVNQQLNDFNADILPPPAYLVEAYLVAHLTTRPNGDVDRLADKLVGLKKQWRERADHWAASDLDDGLKSGLAATVERDGEAFWKIIEDDLLPAARSGDPAAQAGAMAKLDTVYERHRAAIDMLVADAAKRQNELSTQAAGTVLITLTGLGVVVLLLFSAFVSALMILRRKVVQPLEETADTMKRMANGDLEADRRDAHKDDEIGQMTRAIEVFRQSAIDAREADAERKRIVSVLREKLSAMAQGKLDEPIQGYFAEAYKGIRMDFNQAQAALRDVIQSVVKSAEEIERSATEVNGAAADLSERAARQAATLEETAAALQRTNQGIQSGSQLAQETNAEVFLARQNATRNRELVEAAVAAMEQIQASFAQVTNVTDLIQNIAFQTNILALNAGVEATRAGEAGKGFIVVANEVRALAQRSSEAVKEIQDLMAKSSESIARGSEQVVSSGNALREMIGIIDRVSERVEKLADSSKSQASHLNEVSCAVSDLERDTQQNAAMAEQSSAASELLKQAVTTLTGRTAVFTRSDTGSPAEHAATLIDMQGYRRTHLART